MRILLIEDDINIASFILKGLKQEGYTVVHAIDGNSGYELASQDTYDLSIIDIMLPGMDGFTLIEKLRNCNNQMPIIIVSAKNEVENRVKGLCMGADDYIVKPFAFAELIARIQTVLKRSNNIGDVLTYGDVTIDIKKRKVTRCNSVINLQPLEFELLKYLLENQGRIISRSMLIENVWDFNFDPQTNVVDARICRLRDKLDKPFNTKLIHTVKGAGYVMEER